jgi:flagellin
MGLRINTNIASINAQNNLRKTKIVRDSALEKLSSGERINKASDDAAGLAISEKLRAQIRGNDQAIRNANDGVSLVQVTEGALNEVSNILIRLRELAVQAASDTVGQAERSFIDIEVQQLNDEIQRLAQVTRFGDTRLLNGEGGALEVQVGTSNDIFEDRIGLDMSEIDVTTDTLGIEGISFAEKDGAHEAMGLLDTALTKVNSNRANLGALQNRLLSTMSNLASSNENLSASNSRIRDADIARQSSEMIKQSILQQTGVAVLASANQTPKAALTLLS